MAAELAAAPRSTERLSSSAKTTTPLTESLLAHVWAKPDSGWLLLVQIALSGPGLMTIAIVVTLAKGIGTWGNNIPVAWALRHHQLRLVDRYRPRRHADLRHPLSLPAEVAHVDQPLRRGDDHLRGHLRRALPGACTPAGPGSPTGCSRTRATIADLAAVQEPADVGRVRGLDLLHRLAAVLVPGPHPGPGGAARRVHSRKSSARSTALFALGWRGSGRHWANYKWAYLLLAGLSTPLVLSVHTIVSFDFAVSLLPGWHTTIFPPYFVAGAVFSGFAMVMTWMHAGPRTSSGSSTSSPCGTWRT